MIYSFYSKNNSYNFLEKLTSEELLQFERSEQSIVKQHEQLIAKYQEIANERK